LRTRFAHQANIAWIFERFIDKIMADVYVNVPLKVQTLLNKDLYVTKIRKKSRLRWLFLALLLVLLPAGVYAQDDPITARRAAGPV